jgi:hypothetical protein
MRIPVAIAALPGGAKLVPSLVARMQANAEKNAETPEASNMGKFPWTYHAVLEVEVVQFLALIAAAGSYHAQIFFFHAAIFGAKKPSRDVLAR